MKTVIVQNQRSQWKIVLAPEANRVTCFAARELRNYIERMTRIALPIEKKNLGSSCFHLIETRRFGSEGFQIRVAEDLIAIRGNGIGILYGVYAFLESVGCRFIVPGDDCVPNLTALEVKQGVITESPDVNWRMARLIDPLKSADPAKDLIAQIDWCAKNRINWIECTRGWPGGRSYGGQPLWASDRILKEYVAEAALDRGIKLMAFGHSFFQWCPPEEFFATHPEYFSEIDGKRRPKQLCLTNPEVERIVADRIIAFFNQAPEIQAVNLGPQDGTDWCNCKACQKVDSPMENAGGLYKDYPKRSRSYFEFVARVAKRVARIHPERFVGAYAYIHYTEPPKDFKPTTPNMVILLAWYWICSTHVLDDPVCEINSYFWVTQKKWMKALQGKTPLLALDYHYGMSGWNLLPWPGLRASALNWKASIPLGVQGFAFQYYKADTVLYRLIDYVWARFMWNKARANQWADLLRQACMDYFGGEAGKIIAAYQLQIERYAESFSGHLQPTVTDFLPRLINSRQLGRFCKIAERVRRLHLSPLQAQRVARFLWQHNLLNAMWQTVTHCQKGQRASRKGKQQEARSHFAKTIQFGLDTIKHWPDNPGMLNHAVNAIRMAQKHLGKKCLKDTRLADDKVAADLLALL